MGQEVNIIKEAPERLVNDTSAIDTGPTPNATSASQVLIGELSRRASPPSPQPADPIILEATSSSSSCVPRLVESQRDGAGAIGDRQRNLTDQHENSRPLDTGGNNDQSGIQLRL